MEPKRRYFENLDGLRFALAIIVFASHSLLGDVLKRLSPLEFIDRLIGVFSTGFLGVSCFFVLSGFLITYLMMEEYTNKSTIDLKNFYIRRILRIWPLYYSVLIFTFFIYPVIKVRFGYIDKNPFDLLYQLTFLANFDSISVQNLNLTAVAPMMISINWSVAIEEQFYLIWPILFLIFPPQKFWIQCCVIIITSFVFRFLIGNSAMMYYHTLSVMSDLGIGALTACLCYYNKRFLKMLEDLDKRLIILLYVIGISLLMYTDLIFDKDLNSLIRVVNALFFAFIIAEQSFSSQSFFKFSNNKLISSLGKYTFGLYMLHPIGIQASIILFRYLNIDRSNSLVSGFSYSAFAFLISMSLAFAAYHLIEKNFLSLRKRFY
jgi:peptidoglycan/LPS O-acetylase OafA/YrhL